MGEAPRGMLNGTSSGEPALARRMGLWALVLYGVGDTLGAGIYALIGKVAGVAGNAVWLAFMLSLAAALCTAMSYASLGSRYPRAAGAAYVTQRAFGQPFLSYLVGLAVMASGLTSFGAQARAFPGYFGGLIYGDLASAPAYFGLAAMLGFIALLTLVNFWGIRESAWFNIVCTIVEVSGLLIIIAVGLRYWGSVNYLEMPRESVRPGTLSLPLLLQGGALAFYAFVGFEDMINVSEEVKNPRRNFPIAILLALGITSVIYFAVSISAVSVVPYGRLAASSQPLVDVVREASPGFPVKLFSLIALFAIANTALLNYVMGSRLVYGMARQGFVPRVLGRVHAWRRTPHVAILSLMLIVIVLVLAGDLRDLAAATAVLLLYVFMVINAAWIVLRNRKGEPEASFRTPAFVALLGIGVCAMLVAYADAKAMKIALLMLIGITLLFLAARPTNVTEEALAEAERISD